MTRSLRDPAAHLVDHLAVVRHHQDRRAGAVDAIKELHDPHGGVGVEVSGRLVTDQERRVVDEGARNRDSLLLASGELIGEGVHLVREADHVHDLGHLAPNVAAALTLNLQRVRDILGRGAGRKELEVLEDAADVAAQLRDVRAAEPGQVAAADEDPPAGRLELLQQEADDRRLAGTGGADDEDELALLDHERDVAERRHVGVVDLGDGFEDDHRARTRRRRLDRLQFRERCHGSFLCLKGYVRHRVL